MTSDRTKQERGLLWRDVIFIATGVAAAWWMAHSGAVEIVLASTRHFLFVGSFVAGLFFTSVFTFAPAVVVLGELARESHSILQVALFGAAGTLIGEWVLFRFVRDRLLKDIKLAAEKLRFRHTFDVLRFSPLRWLLIVVGLVFIISPLPDEPAFMLLGIAKMPTRYFIPLMFILNFIGIAIIGMVARRI